MLPLSFFKNSKWMGLYDLRYLSKPLVSFSFPNVTTLAVIRCSHRVIPDLITPRHFPNLETIHYLSLHPGSFTLHREIDSSVRWVFPAVDYPFYESMVNAGYGSYDSQLITRYIPSFYRANGRIAFRLQLPEYFMMDGPIYKRALFEYMYMNQHYTLDSSCSSKPIVSSPFWSSSYDEYMKKYICQSFMGCLLEEEEKELGINRLDATPYRNSSK
jgi:hypothetical protein